MATAGSLRSPQKPNESERPSKRNHQFKQEPSAEQCSARRGGAFCCSPAIDIGQLSSHHHPALQSKVIVLALGTVVFWRRARDSCRETQLRAAQVVHWGLFLHLWQLCTVDVQATFYPPNSSTVMRDWESPATNQLSPAQTGQRCRVPSGVRARSCGPM